ncbi:glycosyltransferase [Vibrio splendidus]
MSIVFVCLTLGGGGAERVIQTLSSKLVKLGFRVTIICLENSDPTYNYPPEVKIVKLKTSVLLKGFGKFIGIPFQALELALFLRRNKNCSVMSFLVRANFTLILSSLFSKRKTIISERNHSQTQYENKGFRNLIFRNLIGVLYRKCDVIVPISYGIEDSLINYFGVNGPLYKTIYNPQDINRIRSIDVVSDNLVSSNCFNYVTAGRLIAQKDHATLIRSFKNVINTMPKSMLYILGDGPLKSDLTRLITTLGLEESVRLVGFKENAFDYFKKSDCFVFSSKFEGFGNVLVEAMACGLPIVSTDCPSGPSEILSDGKFGFLSPVGNVEKLSDNMISVQRKNNAKIYSELSAKRCMDFDVDKVFSQYLEVLEVDL